MAVTVPIVADFDSSGVDKAKASFTSLSTQLGKAFAEVRRSATSSLDALEDGLDDSRTAGQKLAAQLGQAATKISADMERARQTADNLANALGPEMAASLGQAGIDRLVRDLQKAGLTLEDINQSADELATSLRQLNDVPVQAVGQKLDKVADSADRSRSVMANFTGNALQELPLMAGAFGPLNMALGQFGEYAAEGGISMKGLAATLGPIAVGSLVIGQIAEAFQTAAEAQKFNREQTDKLVDALREGQTVAEAMRDAILETGQIEFFREGAKDLVPTLAKLNLDMQDFLNLVDMGPRKFKAWIKELTGGVTDFSPDTGREFWALSDAADRLGVSMGQLQNLYTAVTDAQNNATDAAARYAQQTVVINGILEYTATELAAVAGAAENTAFGFQSVNRETEQVNPGAIAGLEVAFGGVAVQAGIAADEAKNFEEAYRAILDALDIEDFEDRVEGAFDRVRESGREAFDAAAKGAADAAEKAEMYDDDLRNLKRTVTDYAIEVLKLPPEVITEILAELDYDSLDDVERQLDMLAKERFVFLTPVTKKPPQRTMTPDGENAYGGSVSSNKTYLVGERGPELFVPQGAGQIIPNHRMAPLGAAAAGTVVNVTVNGALDPVQTAYQIRRILNDDQARQAATSVVGV